jgi:hypothetical protein
VGMSWMWTLAFGHHEDCTPTHGYAATREAVAPHLQNLEQQNTELRQRVARESRRNLDAAVEKAIPNYREIDADPRWHQWLLGEDPLSGRRRQDLLNDAIARGDIYRCVGFFRSFLAQLNSETPAASGRSREGRRPKAPSGKKIYTRAEIAAAYKAYDRGEYEGREDEWRALEQDMAAAQREGRLGGPDYLTK